ncbi:MAG: hypothetical protein Q9166_006708 [cf. Caloplaca sp. 2 TL-2023]
MTGATLGGGIGPYSGLHGTTSDSASSIEIVTGNGELLTASTSENSDLFWGTRGAGFNFGVVTSVTYNIYDATNGGLAMNADMTFAGSQNHSVWSLAQSFVGAQPKELSITFSISYNSLMEQIVLIGNFIYAGPLEEGKQLIKPFLDLSPTNTNISYLPWKDLENAAIYGATVQGCTPGVNFIPHGINLYQFDVDNLIRVVNFMNESMYQLPAVRTSVVALTQYAPYGFQQHPDNSSAFSFRNTLIYAQVDGFFANITDGPVVDKWGQQVRTQLQQGSGQSRLEVYVHFAHGDEGSESWYAGAKMPRLKHLKQKYDPYSLFSYYNPISGVKTDRSNLTYRD